MFSLLHFWGGEGHLCNVACFSFFQFLPRGQLSWYRKQNDQNHIWHFSRCGVCGDAFDEPSPQHHETGGDYGNAVITKTYVKNSVIQLEVELTANHKGRFTFKLCPVRGGRQEATQKCLDKHPLTQLDGEEEFPILEHKNKFLLRRKARLPQGLTCQRCVLQWTWTSANSWGNCNNGTAGLGCGPQETFRNCADVRIVSSARFLPATDNPRAIMIRDATAKNGQRPLVIRSQVCIATTAYKAFGRAMDTWCQHNCLNYPPNCPPDICTCPDTCKARSGSDLSEFECNKRCLRFPHTEQCPTECSCEAHQGQDFAGMDAVVIDARVVARTSSNQLTQSFLSWIPRPGLPWRWLQTDPRRSFKKIVTIIKGILIYIKHYTM